MTQNPKPMMFDDMQRSSSTSFWPRNPVRAFTLAASAYLLLSLLATYYFISHYPTGITGNLVFDDAYYYLGVAQNIALRRIVTDDECARAALFFASDYASAVTGAILDCNGGEFLPS